MIKNWWKFLGAFLVLYSLIACFFVPLGPGIDDVSVDVFEVNQPLVFEAPGYNTSFDPANPPNAWLHNGDLSQRKKEEILCAENVEVLRPGLLKLTFPAVENPAKRTMNLIVHDEHHGLMIREKAFFVNRDTNLAAVPFPAGCALDSLQPENPPYFHFPYRSLLVETIRNLYLHVPMWFAMIAVLFLSLVHSIIHLRNSKTESDIRAVNYAWIGMFFGIIGLVTGMLWARFTWGNWWENDPRLNGSAITLLIYLAYFILRNSVDDEEKRGRLGAVYNIFAYVMLIVFLLVLPRLSDSLHPGAGGNPAFSQYDLNGQMRLVFYPAVLGWILFGAWMAILQVRLAILKRKIDTP